MIGCIRNMIARHVEPHPRVDIRQAADRIAQMERERAKLQLRREAAAQALKDDLNRLLAIQNNERRS